jgi:hypothetical protein
MEINPDVLSNVIEAALAAVGGDKRWQNAINKGAQLIEEERCLPTTDGRLLIFSPSGLEYTTTANDCRAGDAPCEAYARGLPCKHRAAYRLLTLVERAEEASATSH